MCGASAGTEGRGRSAQVLLVSVFQQVLYAAVAGQVWGTGRTTPLVDRTHAVCRDGTLHAPHTFGSLIDWNSQHKLAAPDEDLKRDFAAPAVWQAPLP